VSSRRASPERFYHDEALGLFRQLVTNYLAENEAFPEVLSQREVTFYVAKTIAFLFAQTCPV